MAQIAQNANESVARGVEGSGEAQVLQSRQQDPLGRYYRARSLGQPDPEVAAKKQEERLDAFNDLLDTDFDYGWQIHDQEVQDQIDGFRNQITNFYKNGGDFANADFQRVAKSEVDRINLLARRSTQMKDVDKRIRDEINSDNEYNQEAAKRALTREQLNENDDGTFGNRSAFDMSEENMNAVKSDSRYFNMANVWENSIDQFSENKHKAYKQFFKENGTDTEVTSYFGKLTNPDGTLNFGDKEKMVLYQHPKVKLYVDQQRELYDQGYQALRDAIEEGDLEDPMVKAINDYHKELVAGGATSQEAWENIEDQYDRDAEQSIWGEAETILRRSQSVQKTRTSKFNPEWTTRGKVKVNPSDRGGSVVRNVNVVNPDDPDNPTPTQIPVYEEYEIVGDKADKTLRIEPNWYMDMRSGKVERGQPGDSEFIPTTIQVIPWSKYWDNVEEGAEGGAEPNQGYIRIGEKDKLFGDQMKNDTVGTRVMVQGTLKDTDANGLETEKQVFIPYEAVEQSLKIKTGFDFNSQVPLQRYSRERLVDNVRRVDKSLTRKEMIDVVEYIQENGATKEDIPEIIRLIREYEKE